LEKHRAVQNTPFVAKHNRTAQDVHIFAAKDCSPPAQQTRFETRLIPILKGETHDSSEFTIDKANQILV
jgi:hypothetical protein